VTAKIARALATLTTLGFIAWMLYGAVMPPPVTRDDEIVIRIWEWSWSVDEPAHDVADRRACAAGGESCAAHARVPLIVVPVGRTTQLRLESLDTTHVFTIPELGVERSIFPGRDNLILLTPSEVGTFVVNADENCGDTSVDMTGRIRVIEAAAWKRWTAAGRGASPPP
jgi:cytochrome c oxidase subunit 2